MDKQPETELLDILKASTIDPQLVSTFTRLWQFENWLRHMVYAEFRAKYGTEWSSKLNKDYAENIKEREKELTHMPTPEEATISFLTFGQLCKALLDEWELFSKYLPPKKIWEARIDEVKQIRNRVAHFRSLHRDDFQRVVQLMRDVDKGFWDFCVSFNDGSIMPHDTEDPIITHFSSLDSWGSHNGGNPMYAHYAKSISLHIRVSARPWVADKKPSEVLGKYGYFYDVTLVGLNSVRFRTNEILKFTTSIHQSFVYFCCDALEDSIRVLIPTSTEKDTIISLIDTVIQAALNNRNPIPYSSDGDDSVEREMTRVQAIADNWAENILGPKNPLTFLSPDMQCSFFTI